MGRRTLAWSAAIVIVLASFGWAAATHVPAASARSAASATYLNVTATNSYSFVVQSTGSATVGNVPLNTNLTVEFTDAAAVGHTFTILKWQGHEVPSSAQPTDITNLAYGNGTNEGNLVDVVIASGPGSASKTFTSPSSPGWYEFLCTVSGHFSLGMYGFIAFGEPVPANLTVSGPSTGVGLPVYIIVGTIVTLTVIAIVLGFVVGRRHGSEHEMPPERVGYPEPPSGGTPPGGPSI